MKKVSNRPEWDQQMDMRGGPQQSTHKGVKFQRVRWKTDSIFYSIMYSIRVFFQYARAQSKSSNTQTFTNIEMIYLLRVHRIFCHLYFA